MSVGKRLCWFFLTRSFFAETQKRTGSRLLEGEPHGHHQTEKGGEMVPLKLESKSSIEKRVKTVSVITS